MTRDVKSIPEVTSLQAASFGFVSFHVASTVSVLDDVEDTCPTEPEESGDYKTWNMMLEELLKIAAAKCEVGEIEKRRREQQSPEPSKLNKINIEEIVRSCEV